MQRIISIIISVLFITASSTSFAGHFLEPMQTEIALTPPRGNLFTSVQYNYKRFSHTTKQSNLTTELEYGLSERAQLNFETEFLLNDQTPNGESDERGIEEISFGLKYRFQDETELIPASAFEFEFTPSGGISDEESEFLAMLIFSKYLTPNILTHLNIGTKISTEKEEDDNGNHPTTTDMIINFSAMYKLSSERLLFGAEINGKQNFQNSVFEIVVAPEVIFTAKGLSFKLSTPFGITDDATDFGLNFEISKLW
ncbi:MAG: hypothetical protein ACUZ8E_08630 [Candidatus Anammoxibacter sp.]